MNKEFVAPKVPDAFVLPPYGTVAGDTVDALPQIDGDAGGCEYYEAQEVAIADPAVEQSALPAEAQDETSSSKGAKNPRPELYADARPEWTDSFNQHFVDSRVAMTRAVRRVFRYDQHVTEEVVADAYQRAWHYWGTYRGGSDRTAWLSTIAYHRAIDRWRLESRKRDHEMPCDYHDYSDSMSSGEDIAEDVVDGIVSNDHQALVKMLELIHPEWRQCFFRISILRQPAARVAAEMQIKEATVKTRAHRASKELLAKLQEEHGASDPAELRNIVAKLLGVVS